VLAEVKEKVIKKRIRYNQGTLAGHEKELSAAIADDLIAHGVAEEVKVKDKSQ
jgi:hypothetical protein